MHPFIPALSALSFDRLSAAAHDAHLTHVAHSVHLRSYLNGAVDVEEWRRDDWRRFRQFAAVCMPPKAKVHRCDLLEGDDPERSGESAAETPAEVVVRELADEIVGYLGYWEVRDLAHDTVDWPLKRAAEERFKELDSIVDILRCSGMFAYTVCGVPRT